MLIYPRLAFCHRGTTRVGSVFLRAIVAMIEGHGRVFGLNIASKSAQYFHVV